jgi:hypothetical protein
VSPPCPNGRAERETKEPLIKLRRKTHMKRIVSFVTAGIIISATLLIVIQPQTKAAFHHWTATIGYDGPDYFSECVHTNTDHYDDCCVGVGLAAQYDFGLWTMYEQVAYNYGAWSFYAGVGAYNDEGRDPAYQFYSVPYCEYDINQYGYYQGTGFYSQSSAQWNGHSLGITTYYPGPYLTSYMSINPVASSINGESYEAFQEIENLNHLVYLSAMPTGSYYTIMTATSPPPSDYGDEYWG